MPILTLLSWSATGVLAIPVLASAVYYVLGVGWVRRWMQEPLPTASSRVEPHPPVTFFRPLKAGVPELREKLALLAESMEPHDQLLIGVEPGTLEETVAGELFTAFPQREILVVPCTPGRTVNPKISKLVQMESKARHEHWILSDSETALAADFLTAFRDEWRGCDVLTTAYRVTGAQTWPQQLDAAATLLTLWPGLAVLRANRALRLTIGACTGFQRSHLQAIGGWEAFGDELAEDHRLGLALAAAGHRVQLSRSVVSLASDPLTWGDYWRHQRRVAVTYRVANPGGFAGAVLAQGVTAGGLFALLHPTCPWAWSLFAGILILRWLTARKIARLAAFALSATLPLVFLASLVESVCWGLSWITRRVWWSGAFWRLDRRGRLQRIPSD